MLTKKAVKSGKKMKAEDAHVIIFLQLKDAARRLNISEISAIFQKYGGLVPLNSNTNAYSESEHYKSGRYSTISVDDDVRHYYISVTYHCYWDDLPKRWKVSVLEKIEIIPCPSGNEHYESGGACVHHWIRSGYFSARCLWCGKEARG